jgi:hypothetical protein
MKTLALITTAFLLTGILSAQQLQEGNLVGTHIAKVTLAPGVTMDQFVNFWKTQAMPAYNEAYPGWKMHLLKSLRGDVPKDNLGILFIIDSQETRDKYYNPDNTLSDLGKTAAAKLKPMNDEFNKLGSSETTYTDWIVTGKNGQLSQHNLQSGNFIGLHTIKIDLKPGVTMDQYIQAVNEKVSPEMTRLDPSWHTYPLKKVRGDASEDYGLLYIVDNEKERDKYFNTDGTGNEEMDKINQKSQKLDEEMNKLGTQSSVTWSDWIIL